MSKEMALNMYSAVSNPLTSDDRVKLCNAVLRSTDNRPVLTSIVIPVVVIQSMDDVLVSVSNADTLLHDNTAVKNIWPSDSLSDSDAAPKHVGDDVILDHKAMKLITVSVTCTCFT